MQARYYAQALIHFLAEHPKMEVETALERLKKVLAHRGHEKLYPRTASEVLREVERQEKSKVVSITIADEKSRNNALKDAARVLQSQGIEQGEVEVCIDPNVLTGFKLKGPGFRYDYTGKNTLQQLYKTLTTSN